MASLAPTEAEAGPPAPPVGAGVQEWEAELAPTEPQIEAAEVEIPDWLIRLAPAEVEIPAALEREAPPLPGAELDISLAESGLAQAEIPTWLQALRPGETSVTRPVEEREVETRGLLAGIAGVVQPASAIDVLPAKLAQPEGMSAEAALARARLWQELIARSTQPAALELPREHFMTARQRIERWLVYALVLVAVVIPAATGIELGDFLALDEPPTEQVDHAYQMVAQAATAQSGPVLIAFDYDPAFMGELNAQAEAILHHLTQNQTPIMALSLTPEGAGLAQRLYDDVLAEKGYTAGSDYVNLGFVPGEAVGVRSLEFLPRHFRGAAFDGVQLENAPIFSGTERFSLSQASLIVVLTNNAHDLRWWIEQTAVLETKLDKELPLIAGVSAAIEPLVRPYYDMAAPQIDGLIVGLSGAVDYEKALNWTDGPAHLRWSGQLVGILAVAGLILIGIILGSVRQSDDAKHSGEEAT